jgi:hypothetical protein
MPLTTVVPPYKLTDRIISKIRGKKNRTSDEAVL